MLVALACALPAGWSQLRQEAVQREEPADFQMAQAQKGARKNALIIKHGWDIMTVDGMVRAQDEINRSPFDGIVFSGQRASRIFSGNPISQDEIANALNPLSQIKFTGPTHNYMIVYVDTVSGGFSGANLDTFVENARKLGRIAGKLGIEGIAFDNEVYAGNPWSMDAACPGLSDTDQCRRIAFNAGKRWMAALMEGWPDIRLFSFFGPWLHDPNSYKWFNDYSIQNDWSKNRDNRVTCNFLAGVYAASAGKRSQYLDGGEIYALRSQEDYANTADWMRYFIPYVTDFFPEQYRADYHKNMGVAFGLYDDRDHLYTKLPRITPKIWGSMIRNAKKSADLVWLYTERHDWWLTDGNNWPDTSRSDTEGFVDEDWLQETRAAIEAP